MLRLIVGNPDLQQHLCYVLSSDVSSRQYIGYTVDFKRRLRQHNGEITGGAKKTSKYRPWRPFCIITGFNESSVALRFEYRLQHSPKHLKTMIDKISYLINNGDGKMDSKIPWPNLTIYWADLNIYLPNVNNLYIDQSIF